MLDPRSPSATSSLDGSGLLLCERALRMAGVGTPRRVLDLPSGHGRVLRFLCGAYPDATIVGADIDPDAVNFCSKTLGATPLQSANPLSSVDLGEPYDLICADDHRNLPRVDH